MAKKAKAPKVFLDLHLMALPPHPEAVISAFTRAARQAGWPEEEIATVVAQAGDSYPQALDAIGRRCTGGGF